jgi:hypothetical protein
MSRFVDDCVRPFVRANGNTPKSQESVKHIHEQAKAAAVRAQHAKALSGTLEVDGVVVCTKA